MFFHWELEFPEVFYDKGREKEKPGFDAVVGNPPYASEAREHKALFESLKKLPSLMNYYQKNIDLFNFFVDIGIDLARRNGYFSYIIPQYWQTRTSSEKMVLKILNETKIDAIVHFNEFKVFEEAQGHHSSILVLKNQNAKPNSGRFIEILNKTASKEEVIMELRSKGSIAVFKLSANKLIIKKEGTIDVLDVIRNTDCVYLEDKRVVRGVDTSPSTHEGKGVFVLSKYEFEAMKPLLNKNEMELIKPFYEANQIDAYYYDGQNYYWLIYTDRNRRELIEKKPKSYPTIVAHLNTFKKHITSDNKPYGLHRAKDENQFLEKNKIVFVRKTPHPKFTVVEHDFFCDESVFYILPKEEQHSQLFLISVLNSKVAFYWFFKHKTQGKQLQIDKEIVLSFPLPRIVFNTPKERRKTAFEKTIILYNADEYDHVLNWAEKEISENRNDTIHDFLAFLARQMIDLKLKGKTPASTIEEKLKQTGWLIDQIVYNLYGLTEEEIKVVEGRG